MNTYKIVFRPQGYSDIGYSFMIGGNGEVFEGRGWDRTGGHTLNYNSIGYGKD